MIQTMYQTKPYHKWEENTSSPSLSLRRPLRALSSPICSFLPPLLLFLSLLLLPTGPVFALEEDYSDMSVVFEEGFSEAEETVEDYLPEGCFGVEAFEERRSEDDLLEEDFVEEEAFVEELFPVDLPEEEPLDGPLPPEWIPAFTEEIPFITDEDPPLDEVIPIGLRAEEREPVTPLYIGHPLQGRYAEYGPQGPYFDFYSKCILSKFRYYLILSDFSEVECSPDDEGFEYFYSCQAWKEGDHNPLYLTVQGKDSHMLLTVIAPDIKALTQGEKEAFTEPNAGKDLLVSFTPEETGYYCFELSKDVPFDIARKDGIFLPPYVEENASLPRYALARGTTYTLLIQDMEGPLQILCQKAPSPAATSPTATSFSASLLDPDEVLSLEDPYLGYWQDTDTFLLRATSLLSLLQFDVSYEDGKRETFTYQDRTVNPCLPNAHLEGDYLPYHPGSTEVSLTVYFEDLSAGIVLPMGNQAAPSRLQLGDTKVLAGEKEAFLFTPSATGTYLLLSTDDTLSLFIEEEKAKDARAYFVGTYEGNSVMTFTEGNTYLLTASKRFETDEASITFHQITDLSLSLQETKELYYGNPDLGFWDEDGFFVMDPHNLSSYLSLSVTLETGESFPSTPQSLDAHYVMKEEPKPGKALPLTITIGDFTKELLIPLASLLDRYPPEQSLSLQEDFSLPVTLEEGDRISFLLTPSEDGYFHFTSEKKTLTFSLYEMKDGGMPQKMDEDEELFCSLEGGHTYLLLAASSYGNTHTITGNKEKLPVSIQPVLGEMDLPLTPLPGINCRSFRHQYVFDTDYLRRYISVFVIYEDETGEVLPGNDPRLTLSLNVIFSRYFTKK